MWKFNNLLMGRLSTKQNRKCKAKVLGTVEIYDKKEMKGMTKAERQKFVAAAAQKVGQLRAQFKPEEVRAIRRKSGA